MHLVGLVYKVGDNETPPNIHQAILWIRKSSNLSYSAAQYKLATCYLKGHGIPQNVQRSISLLKSCADYCSQAEALLGYILITGFEILYYIDKAFQWLEKSCQSWYPHSNESSCALLL